MKPALLLLALFALLRVLDPVSIETFRLKYFDTIFYWGEMGASQNVAVWDIDEEEEDSFRLSLLQELEENKTPFTSEEF